MTTPRDGLIEKIRHNTQLPGGAITASYLAGLRDAEEYLRELDSLDAPLAHKKHELKQQFLQIMKEGQEHSAVQLATPSSR